MDAPVHDYMKIGIVHFMAFPECIGGDGPITDTVAYLAGDTFFDLIELGPIKISGARKHVRELLEQCGVEATVACQPTQLGNDLDINHVDEATRNKAVVALRTEIDHAAELGVSNVAVMSGKAGGDHAQATERLVDSLLKLCEHAATKDIAVALETFDQVPFGKNRLIGSTVDAVRVSEKVRSTFPDFGLLLDLSHLPLLGESSEHALSTAGPHLVHAHIGNCAMDDPNHPAYGDNHPRFGAPGTRNGVEELAEFLRVLLKIGYLEKGIKRIVSFEVRPMPGESPYAVIAGSKRALIDAWRKA